MGRFTDKRVLITGGTSGIGLAAARRIAAEGGKVAVTGRKAERLKTTAEVLPVESLVFANDAGDPQAAPALAAAIKDAWGGVDGVFLNAGLGKFTETEAVDAEHYAAVSDANVRGPLLQMAALKPLIAAGGSVVVTASVAPYLGQAQGAVYSASKAAVTAITRSWAVDLAPAGVRVNSLAPGPIETNFFEGFELDEEQIAAFAEHILKQVPLNRFGTSQEAAAVACFLLSDDAAYVTGSQYVVDGGMTLR